VKLPTLRRIILFSVPLLSFCTAARSQSRESPNEGSSSSAGKSGATQGELHSVIAKPDPIQDDVRLLVSGDLSRMRDGVDLVRPVGGLGDEKQGGLLKELHDIESKYATPALLLLSGNNLGRAIKSGALSSASRGLPQQTLPQQPNGQLAALVVTSDVDRLRELLRTAMSRIREVGPDLNDPGCTESSKAQSDHLSELEKQSTQPSQADIDAVWAAVDRCDGAVFLWQIQSRFDAIAIGPGDFNYSRDDALVKQLRHAPFLAANLFVLKEDAKPFKPNRKDPRLLVEGQEIFPGAPIVIDAGDDPRTAICTVTISSTFTQRAWASALATPADSPSWDSNPVYTFRFQTAAECAKNPPTSRKGIGRKQRVPNADAQTVEYKYEENGRLRVATFPSEPYVTTEDNSQVITFKMPVPLSPATTYKITIDYRGTSHKPREMQFSTFELFTITYPWSRGRSGVSADDRTLVLTLEQASAPNDQARTHSSVAGLKISPRTDWLGLDMPLRCRSIQTKAHEQIRDLCILSVLDEKKTVELPTDLTGKKADFTPGQKIINRIQTQPMSESVGYWKSELEWLEKKKLIAQLAVEASAADKPLTTEIRSFCQLMTDPQLCIPDTSNHDVTLHLETEELTKLLESHERVPAVVLLAQSDAAGVDALAQKNPDFVLVVGEAGVKSTIADSTVGIHGPLRTAPLAFASSVEEITLHLSSNSAWQVQNAEYKRHDGSAHQGIPGVQTTVLFPESAELQQCCHVGKLEKLMAWALVSDFDASESRLPTQKLLKNDSPRLYNVVLQTMRQSTRAEVALLPNDFIDPLPLRWLRALRWLACQTENLEYRNCPVMPPQPKPSHFTLDLSSATLEQLQAIPGISPEAAKAVRANRLTIRTRANLQDPNVMHDAKLSDSEYGWARWFVHGPEDLPDSMPYINEELLVDVILHRLLFVNQDPKAVVLTADLAKTLYTKSAGAVQTAGFDKDGLDVFVDAARPLQGSQPIIAVASAPLAQKKGPFPDALDDATVQRPPSRVKSDTISTGSRNEVLNKNINDKKIPKDKNGYLDVEQIVDNWTRRPRWGLSLQQIGLSFNQISNSANFKPITNEPATQAKSQRIISVGPRVTAGLYSPHLEWINSIGIDYQTNEIYPNNINATLDQYRLRTELDWYWQGARRKINFPLYVATEFDSQFRRPLGSITLVDLQGSTLLKTKNLTDPLTFPAVRQKDLVAEAGVLVTNRDKTIWFRIGFAPDHNFNRLDLVTLTENDATVAATPGKISDAVNQVNLAQFNAGNPVPFVPGNLPASLKVVTTTTPAVAFGYSIQHQFQLYANKSKKITVKSDTKEWNFYFRQHDDSSSQPRFRIWIENSVKIPVWGNLSFAPGFDMFVYRSKPDSTGSNPAPAKTFTSWRPTVSLDYSFDWKWGMKLGDALKFENAKQQ
jgi:hypothetical protein